MKFDVVKFYNDYRIPIQDRGKHVRPGWVNTDCPFCGGSDGHLGIHISSGAVKCWKCGKHSQIEVIKAFLNCDWNTAVIVQKEYETNIRPSRLSEEPGQGKTHAEVCKWPLGTGRLSERGKEYLRSRGFDPEELRRIWKLRETNHLGKYKFRIIAPIFFNGVMVSYQGRDITGKSELRWKACDQQNEVIDHQTILDGLDLLKGDACVVVEGRADAWRLGPGAVCIFGIAFTTSQVNLLSERCRKVFILFDAEREAQKQARKLAVLLSARGVEVEILELETGDPGEMNQEEADELMKSLGFK